MKTYILLLLSCCCSYTYAQKVNSLGMMMVDIPAGSFEMGSGRGGEDADEGPVHMVSIGSSFRMSATEVTNRQYEAFDSGHYALRGKNGFSKGDDEAVVFVSYQDATAFCAWLSEKEGKAYRLPTEAEWEYACRAGTGNDFFTGDTLPDIFHKSQKTSREPVPVSLQVTETPANAFGLYDMHGNVEEWCYDWYGPYEGGTQNDPVGRVDGLYRVTRGGSHNTPVRYLRSSNRQGMLPKDKHWLTGFRVVQAELPATAALPLPEAPAHMQQVSQQKFKWKKVKKLKPVFLEPMQYIVAPDSLSGTPFYQHHHQPAVTWLPNGDLLASWFSADEESGREMVVLASRLRSGQKSWDKASLFLKVPDRNMTGASLFYDKAGTLYHMNGVEASGDWQNLAMALRTSRDNGATWSKPRLVAPEHEMRHQVIAGMFQTKEGWLLQPCDAVPGPAGGTALYISKDKGETWESPYTDAALPEYKAGASGGLIAGIHAGVVQRRDGSLLAFGRNNNIIAVDSSGLRMPQSISSDMGKSWTYFPSSFPPINSGQRLAMIRLNEGPLLFVSFTHSPGSAGEEENGMLFTKAKGERYKGYGMFAALSFDDGETWPVRKLLTDGTARTLNGGAWTGAFKMDATHAEPKGYLAVTQSPDNIIHLLSSGLHYRFNLAWLKQ